jgi:hypothetical protein
VNLPIEIPLSKSPSITWKEDMRAEGPKKSLIGIESTDEIPSGNLWSLMTVRFGKRKLES